MTVNLNAAPVGSQWKVMSPSSLSGTRAAGLTRFTGTATAGQEGGWGGMAVSGL